MTEYAATLRDGNYLKSHFAQSERLFNLLFRKAIFCYPLLIIFQCNGLVIAAVYLYIFRKMEKRTNKSFNIATTKNIKFFQLIRPAIQRENSYNFPTASNECPNMMLRLGWWCKLNDAGWLTGWLTPSSLRAWAEPDWLSSWKWKNYELSFHII